MCLSKPNTLRRKESGREGEGVKAICCGLVRMKLSDVITATLISRPSGRSTDRHDVLAILACYMTRRVCVRARRCLSVRVRYFANLWLKKNDDS